MINKKTLIDLANLARIDIRNEEEILSDLKEILNYFEELKEIDAQNIVPMSGCNFSQNIIRDENNAQSMLTNADLISYFPREKDKFLFIPPVF